MKINLSTTKTNTGKAYCIRGQQQMSLFSEEQLRSLTPPDKRRTVKRLFCLVEAPDGHSWWQELERVKGEKPWQTCIRYKNETLGRGYWICAYELR